MNKEYAMYKVLLVDDEYFSREALKTTVNWAKYGCEVCTEARSGQEGLNEAAEHQPEIVIADINMPVMDGLKMIEQMRKDLPDTIFIILTGYSEFEYAKRGIELNVRHFLLKPVDNAKMEETLESVVEQLEENKKKNLEYQILRQWASENISDNRCKLLEVLLKDHTAPGREQFEFECTQLDLPITQGAYIVGYMKIDSRTYVKQSQEQWQQEVCQVVGESDNWKCTTYYRGQGDLYLLFSEVDTKKADIGRISELLQRVQVYFIRRWVCTVMVGTGIFCDSFEEISLSCAAAEKAVHNIEASPLIAQMLAMIAENYADPTLNLKDLARRLFVSYTYLSTQFTKEIGMPPSKYITSYRMAMAADAIRSGKTNMVDISASAGYLNIKYFYHVFKKQFGMTPNQYVDLIQKTKEEKL